MTIPFLFAKYSTSQPPLKWEEHVTQFQPTKFKGKKKNLKEG